MPSISEFFDSFKGGTRVNRFKVNVSGCPGGIAGDKELTIRAASFPQMSVTPFPVNFKGKTYNIPNVRNFEPLVITVMDDPDGVDGNLHKQFYNWSNIISPTNADYGVSSLDTATSTRTSKWIITHQDHLKTDGEPTELKKFTLEGVWPMSVGAIQLDMNQNAQIAMFQVTLAYTHITE